MNGFGGVLVTFAGGLAGALVLGYLAKRRKLSPIVGYLLAGIAVGPFTPGFVADRAVAEQFAVRAHLYGGGPKEGGG
jgi:Kef-type K+ transport system, predicted NAD-binding component